MCELSNMKNEKAELEIDSYVWSCPDKECQELNFTDPNNLYDAGELLDVKCGECGKEFQPKLPW